ncbi:LysR substrate-binding domain-containing protein [Pseudomonas gingeri]|uniref:LysR family transcriptional regulator n=1 Tax=Pseudomonas gingeri TaxID=117681 RepID=A0A7Y8BQK4_9PSED|nr:LysR substrate-binding domain-containing protein [Pseudomonas gingeri]NWB84316.1 LysR family transcriptional regulator [Pseudomonas gingeri]
MELRHLRYFLMVAEEQHFTRAALRLNMQQPPLSQQIQALEKELGFDLFRRHSKGVDLTPGGLIFLQEARDILNRVSDATRRSAKAAQGYEGTLSVGLTSSAAAHHLIPHIVRAYREAYPGVSLLLNEGSARELTDDVVQRKLDIGILRVPVSPPHAMSFYQLIEEDMLLVLPIGHRLLKCTRKKKAEGSDEPMPVIALKLLADEPFILVRRSGATGMYSKLIEACENAGFTPKIAFEVERMLTNISLVAAGAGISVVPASMNGFHRKSVVYCHISARPRLVAPITLICRYEEQGPILCNFINLAQRIARS